MDEIGVPGHGGTGSRLLSGNTDFAVQIEQRLAAIFRGEAALVFNSGYQANLCLISSVAQKGDTILYDQLAHVCLKEGAWLSKAQTFSFLHNDVADLERRLKAAEGNCFVVIESVYSMDGDVAPLKQIAELCSRYNARLVVDEAHGTGVFGEGGSGLVCEMGLQDSFFARVYTFGKAMGVHGAAVVGGQSLIEFLINFGRPFIYTTAMPLHSLVAIEQSFEMLASKPELQKELKKRIMFFNEHFPEMPGLQKMESNTSIQPIIVPGNLKAKQMAAELQSKGYDVRPILAPTVKEGQERLRVCLHTYNTENQIKGICQILSQPS